MIRRLANVAVPCALCWATAFAQETADFSGPQASERLPSLNIVDAFATGGEKAHDLIASTDGKPCIVVFIHDLLANKSDEPSLGLAYVLMHYAAERKDTGLVRSVVCLTDDVTAMKTFLRKIRRALPKKETPITISTDGLEGPGSWGLNRNLRMTVVIAKNNRVTANFALRQPSVQADSEKILAELTSVIGGDAPKLADLDFPYYVKKPAEAELTVTAQVSD
jgi:hypothetical protein